MGSSRINPGIANHWSKKMKFEKPPVSIQLLRRREPSDPAVTRRTLCSSSSAAAGLVWLLLAALCILPTFSVSAQAIDPSLIEQPEQTEREKQEEAERREEERKRREERRKKAMDDYWLRLNPGFVLSGGGLSITGQGFRSGTNATIVEDAWKQPNWMLDVSSREWVISKNWGVYFLVHSRQLDLKFQSYTQTVQSEDGSEGSETVTEDLGTRMRGYYAATAPVLYYDFDGEPTGFRIGAGYGSSVVRLRGNASLNSGAAQAPLFISQDQASFTRDLQLSAILQGGLSLTEGDPFYNSLLLDLQQPGGLANMGAYLIARGEIRPDLYTVFLINYLTSGQAPGSIQLSPLEAIGAVGLARLQVDFRVDSAPTYYLMAEHTWEWATLQLAFGGPIFTRAGFKYDLTNMVISFSVPLRL